MIIKILFISHSLFISDVLRGVPPLPEALRPTILRHALALHFRAVEQGKHERHARTRTRTTAIQVLTQFRKLHSFLEGENGLGELVLRFPGQDKKGRNTSLLHGRSLTTVSKFRSVFSCRSGPSACTSARTSTSTTS